MDNKHSASIPVDILMQAQAKAAEIKMLLAPYITVLTPELEILALRRGFRVHNLEILAKSINVLVKSLIKIADSHFLRRDIFQ